MFKKQRASYIGNIVWFDSSTLMKIQSISDNRIKQVIQFENTFMVCCLVYIFLFPHEGFDNTWWW